MADPRTPTEMLAATPFGVGAVEGECAFCGRPAEDGTLCSGCFDERWEFNSDAEADAHARERLAALRLRRECIRCGEQIGNTRFALGSVECEECKPRQAA